MSSGAGDSDYVTQSSGLLGLPAEVPGLRVPGGVQLWAVRGL